MTEYFIDQALKRCEIIFNFSGIIMDIATWKPTSRLNKINMKYRLFFLFNLFTLDSNAVGAILWTIQTSRLSTNLSEYTIMAPCITYCSVASLQSILHIYYQDEIALLFKNLRGLETYLKLNSHKQGIINSNTNLQRIMMKSLIWLSVVTIIAFNVTPLMFMWIKYINTNEVVYKLPYYISYVIFDPYDIKYWPYVYINHVWTGFIVILFVSVTYSIFYTSAIFIRMHFRILKSDFEGIINTEEPFDKEKFHKNFVTLFKRHKLLIQTVDLLESIYNKAILMNFISGSILICFCGFNAMEMSNKFAVVPYAFFLMMCMMQIFFVCLCGDMITSASTEVGDAIYNSSWYMVDPKIGKSLLIILGRSQTPCKITAYGFAHVTINSFTKILSNSWSYFALLETMYSRNKE